MIVRSYRIESRRLVLLKRQHLSGTFPKSKAFSHLRGYGLGIIREHKLWVVRSQA